MTTDLETRERLVRVETLMEGARDDINEGFARIEKKFDDLKGRMTKVEDDIKAVKIGARTLWILGGLVVSASSAITIFVQKWISFLGGVPK